MKAIEVYESAFLLKKGGLFPQTVPLMEDSNKGWL
jgi:hypothetical protein